MMAEAAGGTTRGSRFPFGFMIFSITVLALLIALGTWQVKRLYWKEALIADIEERRSASPVPLSDIEAIAKSGGDIEYRTVSLSGTFDHARERHFFATHQGQTGYYI